MESLVTNDTSLSDLPSLAPFHIPFELSLEKKFVFSDLKSLPAVQHNICVGICVLSLSFEQSKMVIITTNRSSLSLFIFPFSCSLYPFESVLSIYRALDTCSS